MKAKRYFMECTGAVLLSATMSGGAAAQGVAATEGSLQTVAYGQGTSSPVQDDLFAGTEKFAKGASEVSEISMDPDTLDMVNGKDSKRAHNMILNVVRSYEYDKPGMYRIEDVEEFRKKLNTGDWHCSIHTRELKSGESTDICNKRRADGLVEQAIITVEPKELTFIHTIRKAGGGTSLNMPDIGGLMSSLGPELARLGPTMRALRPEMEAEMKATTAEMRAHQGDLADFGFNFEVPKIDIPKIEIPKIDIPKIDTRELDKQMREFQRLTDEQEKSLPKP